MSNALVIAAVTASLKDLLNDGLMKHDLSSVGSFSVTALPPDRITTGQGESSQLNLFLYQVTPNNTWRSERLSSPDGRGVVTTNPPLALDLHYLLSAYGAHDMNAEVLLGYAIQIFGGTPVLSRDVLHKALGESSLVADATQPRVSDTLSALDRTEQAEPIKLVPAFLGIEDLCRLWTAMRASYRPSVAYVASMVLIPSEAGERLVQPVITQKSGPLVR